MTTIRRYLDFVLGLTGSTATLAAITVIVGWPYALLIGGVGLLALAMVVPAWD